MNPFDIQEWKPTFCKTEEELKAFWEEHQIARKKIMKINAIGSGWVVLRRTHTEDIKFRRRFGRAYAENGLGLV